MPALFVFLLKVNIALLLFCAGYYLVLRHLTFYTLNRVYLLAAIVFASVYPQINFSDFVQRHQELAKPVEQVAFNWQLVQNQSFIKPLSQPDYWHWVEVVFWIGAAVLSIRLIVQLISLFRLYKKSAPAIINNHHVRVMDKDAAPFSFWQSIFVNPDKYEPADLNSILLHEQVHVNEWHTADILLAELSSIFYWFNPGIWLIKKAIRENIEFITDQKVLNKGVDSKAYQYSLVSVSFNNTQPNIVNHFNISTIKKRIIMMNAKRSSKLKLTRYAFLVPAVVALLLVFSVSKADFVKPIKNSITDAVRPLANIADITIDYPASGVTAVPVEQPADTSKMNISFSAKPADTTAAHVIVKSDVKDSTVVYVNGKKGDSKNLNPADIVAVYVLHGQEAAPYLNEKLADNIKAAVIITKNSPEGEVLKQKLEFRPRSKVFTFTKLNTISGKGTVSEVMVNGMPVPTTTNATAIYSSDSLMVSPGPKSRIVALSPIKISQPATIVVTRSYKTGSTVALSGYSTPLNTSKFILIKRDSTQTDPKLYIDGKESPMSELKNIEPDMIESINVVKDSTVMKGDKKKAAGSLYIVTKKKKE